MKTTSLSIVALPKLVKSTYLHIRLLTKRSLVFIFPNDPREREIDVVAAALADPPGHRVTELPNDETQLPVGWFGWPLGNRVQWARSRRGMSQQELANRSGLSKNWVGQIERNVITNPGVDTIRKLETVLKAPLLGEGTFGTIASPARRDITGPPITRVEGAQRRPVYKWGAAGNPLAVESSPYPDSEEYPPTGKESLIGPRGFGVRIKGESMSRRGIHDEDIVWVNPDRPHQSGRVVLARIWDHEGVEVGMLVKVLKADNFLWGEGEGDEGHNPVNCSRYEIVGPVVWVESGRPPG